MIDQCPISSNDIMVVAVSMIFGLVIYLHFLSSGNQTISMRPNAVNIYIVVDDGTPLNQSWHPIADTTDANDGVLRPPSQLQQQQQEIPMVPAQLISNETPNAEFIRIDIISS